MERGYLAFKDFWKTIANSTHLGASLMGNANGADNDCRMSGNCMRFLLTLVSYSICRWGSLLVPPFLTLEKNSKLFDTSHMHGSFLSRKKPSKWKQTPKKTPKTPTPQNPNFSQVSICRCLFRFCQSEDNFQRHDGDINSSPCQVFWLYLEELK